MAKKKYIESPEKFLELFKHYVKHTKGTPFKITDWVGSNSRQVFREKEKPLTLAGFENFCFQKGIIADLGDYFSNKNGEYEEYSTICRACKNHIKQDQIEGGMAGIYNPSITQRLNGLTDKIESDNKNMNFLSGNVLQVTTVSTGLPFANRECDVDLS